MKIVVRGWSPIETYPGSGYCTSSGLVDASIEAGSIEEACEKFRVLFPHARELTARGLDHTRADWEALTGEPANAEYTFKDDMDRRDAEREREERRKHWPISMFWPK